jgi:thioredoxin 1
MIAPHIEKMANDYEGRAVIGKVDVDNNPGLTAKFGVRNIPTVIFLKGGEISDKAVGNMPLASLVAKLEKLF